MASGTFGMGENVGSRFALKSISAASNTLPFMKTRSSLPLAVPQFRRSQLMSIPLPTPTCVAF